MELILISLFTFLLPTQLGLHFWPEFSLINGHRLDYFSPTLYFLDFPLILFILISLHKHLPHLKFSYFNLSFLILIIINILFSLRPGVTFFHYLRLLEVVLITYSLVLNSIKFPKVLSQIFPLSLIMFNSLAWMQFFLQHSLNGPWYLFGERQFNLYTPNLAKISLNSWGLFIRPYSTFSHPNALAGFLLVAAFVLKYFYDQKPSKLILSSMVFCLSTILITFSRIAIILTVVLFLFHFLKKTSLLTIPPFLLILLLFTGNTSSLSDRMTGVVVSYNQFIAHPMLGIGFGNTPLVTPDTQPTHFTPLLLLLELGLPLFVVFLSIFIKFFLSFKRLPQTLLFAWMCVLVTSLVDHYWTTQIQNQLILAALFSLSYPHCYPHRLSVKISSS